MAETSLCTTLEALRHALATKPRRQAYVYIGEALYRHLQRTHMSDLSSFRQTGTHHHDLRLVAAEGLTPPEYAYWVCYVVYDDGYETPDEFGDPLVDWVDSDLEDIRCVAALVTHA